MIPVFPTLVCVSYVTIGVKCNDGTDMTLPDFDFDSGEFNNNGHVVGGWLNGTPGNGHGDAGQDPPNQNLQVLLLQLSVASSESITGTINLFVRIDDDVVAFEDQVIECLTAECEEGEPCDDGDACTEGSTCDADGECVGGNPINCGGAGDQCNSASCDPRGAEGNCDILMPFKDGTICNDGDPCTENDTCQRGNCVGRAPLDCTDLDDECNVGVCNPATGQCEQEPRDCNLNDTPDCDDIEDKTSMDCDGNSIPDECDIADCPPGDPDCADCNTNDIPDECDIADCDGNPNCGDCNVNGIPDVCDIDSGFSQDVEPPPDGDGVPDECVEWDGGAKDDDFWSTPENWETDEVPGDDDPGDQESVVIAAAEANVILDIDVSIDSLLLGAGATLHIDREGKLGDMTVEPGGAILVEGNLLVDNDRMIDVTAGEVTIGLGGVYRADSTANGLVSAILQAGSITVRGGTPDDVGGTVILSDSMVLISNGDLLLEEIEDDGKGGCKGSGTPPDFNATGSAQVRVMGDFAIGRCAQVNNTSSEQVMMEGDLQNQSISPTAFNWDAGGLLMNGTSQTIEAAGEDRGPCPAGFNENFVIGTLTLAAGSTTQVVDEFDNQQDGTTACDEALYVGMLILEAGSELLTNGCRVYYEELINDGSIPGLGTDVLQVESSCADIDGNGEVDAFDLAILLGSWGQCPPDDHCPADLDGDGEVGAFDLAILLGNWGSVL